MRLPGEAFFPLAEKLGFHVRDLPEPDERFRLIERSDHVRVYWSSSDNALCWTTDLGSVDGEIDHVLFDLVAPRLFAARGFLVLHGALARTEASAFGLIGPSRHGKSTLSASLYARGCSLISDDAIILRPDGIGYQAERIYPSLRLFPDSLDRLLPGVDGTTPIGGYTSKRRVPFAAGISDAPLRALFHLTAPEDTIRVTRLPQAAACMAIIANAFAFDPGDAYETARRFGQAAQAARSVPVFDLTYPRDYAALPAVHEAIFQTLATLSPPD